MFVRCLFNSKFLYENKSDKIYRTIKQTVGKIKAQYLKSDIGTDVTLSKRGNKSRINIIISKSSIRFVFCRFIRAKVEIKPASASKAQICVRLRSPGEKNKKKIKGMPIISPLNIIKQ